MKKHILVLFLSVFAFSQAQAIVELRAGYGIQTPADSEQNGQTLKSMAGFNVDAIVELPMVPFGFGLRYENLGSKISIPTIGDVDATFERTSLLVNYRIIDLLVYAGLIGSLGFQNNLKVETPGSTTELDTSLTYSVGAEAGVSLGLIMLGAELGYIGAKLKDNTNEGDLSGVYAKALVGVGF